MKNIKRDFIVSTLDRQEKSDDFDLTTFFPYLVRIYYRAVSEAVSKVYTEKFGLSVSEWRTMAVLGLHNSMSASEIVCQSSMDKVVVSRAIKGLQAKGFLKRDIDGDDRRRAALRLTLEGRNTFGILVPKVKQAEENCLRQLSPDERATLIGLMKRVRMNAEGYQPDTGVEGNMNTDG